MVKTVNLVRCNENVMKLTPLPASGMLALVRAGPARQSLPNPARVERQQR